MTAAQPSTNPLSLKGNPYDHSKGETQMTTKSDVLYTESPVSWNTRYISPEGFDC